MSDDFKLDFVGIGAPKAGTSWTAAILNEHPEACLGKEKELDYFMAELPDYMVLRLGTDDPAADKRDINWLKKQFRHCEPGQIKGEYSPRYIIDPGSPRLIYEHNPKAKLLFNLRNPTEAAYSLYYQWHTSHPMEKTFEEIIREEMAKPYASNLFAYKENIDRFLEYFPREQIHIILLDDIKVDNQKVYEDLCAFLGINAVPLEVLNKRVNTATMVRSQRMLRTFYYAQMFIGKHAITRGIRDVMKALFKADKIWGKVKHLNIKQQKYGAMPQNIRELLTEAYADSVNELSEFLGRDLSHWNEIKR